LASTLAAEFAVEPANAKARTVARPGF